MSEGGKVLGVERKKFISILLTIGICYMFLLFFLNRGLFHLAKHLDGKYHAFLGNIRHPTFTILAIIVYTATIFAIWYIAKASKKRQSLMVLFLINAIIGFFALLFLIIIAIIGTVRIVNEEEKWFILAFHAVTLVPLIILHGIITFLLYRFYKATPSESHR